MSRSEAVDLVNSLQYEFPKEYFYEFLEYHELPETEFWEAVARWRNTEIWEKRGSDWRLKVD